MTDDEMAFAIAKCIAPSQSKRLNQNTARIMVYYPMPVETTVECYVHDIDTPNESKMSHNRGSWGEPLMLLA